jgi:AcrR family transcriptional regulator
MLQIAEAIMEKEGLEGLQARKVATECDCAVGTIYNHYKGGLTDLILHVNQRTLEKLAVAVDTVGPPDRHPTLEAHIHAMATAYFRFALEHTARWRALAQFRVETTEAIPDWYRKTQAELWQRLETPLQNRDLDQAEAKRSARMLFSAVHGVVALSLDGKLGQFDCAETHRMLSTVVTALLRHMLDGHSTQPT